MSGERLHDHWSSGLSVSHISIGILIRSISNEYRKHILIGQRFSMEQ